MDEFKVGDLIQPLIYGLIGVVLILGLLHVFINVLCRENIPILNLVGFLRCEFGRGHKYYKEEFTGKLAGTYIYVCKHCYKVKQPAAHHPSPKRKR